MCIRDSQYVGDTRVQCLISIFNSGDARLMRNAIDQINDSRLGDACTMSRYPTRLEQYIPGFSLWWIGMVRDYWWYVDDPAFVRRILPGVRAVLSFFESYQKKDGSLGPLPWWRYFDWEMCIRDRCCLSLRFQVALTLQDADTTGRQRRPGWSWSAG